MTTDYREQLENWAQNHSIAPDKTGDLAAVVDRGTALFESLQKALSTEIKADTRIADELISTTTDPTLLTSCLLYAQLKNIKEDQWPELGGEFAEPMRLCHGMARLCLTPRVQGQSSEQRLAQSDGLRKMLLAMVDDIRVVLIKLCEQASDVRELHTAQDSSQKWIAEMGLHVYATLANRLGLGQIKWVLEDLSFRYLEPGTYIEISKVLQQKRSERELYITRFKEIVSGLLEKNADIKSAIINGRAKHIYSIYKKSKRKKHAYSLVNDARAIRILLPTVSDCYAVLAVVHGEWEPVTEEFDDYIANPKPNGYRSLHTVVKGPEGLSVEIQIRTIDMHEEAELGVAAHWKYKETRSSTKQNKNTKINWLEALLDWQEEIDTDENKQTYQSTFQNRVYVFTPANKVIDLPLKATSLDFAYSVHTEVGHRCVGAKVNGKMAPLTYQLRTGDQVTVLTNKNSTPSRDWLNARDGYVVSRHARSKIRHFFRQEFQEEYVKHGAEAWEKHFGKERFTKQQLAELMKSFNYLKIEDIYASIGSGDIHVRTVANKLRVITGAESEVPQPRKPQPFKQHEHSEKTVVTIEGVSNLLTQLARCCHPVPGDPVRGYITKSSGVSVHRQDCSNIVRTEKAKPERIVSAQWGLKAPQKFPVNIAIISDNDAATDRRIVKFITSQDIPVLSHTSSVNRGECARSYLYKIEVSSKEELDKITTGLVSIPGLRLASRS